MASTTTLLDIQTRVALRLGEDSATDDQNEKARRTQYINEGYKKMLGDGLYYFMQDDSSIISVADQEIYTLPSDFRSIIEVRYNDKVCEAIPQWEAYQSYNYPPTYYMYNSLIQRYYIFGETELHLLPIPSSAPTSYTISSITRSGTTATVTTSEAHGYSNHWYVNIAGSDQSDYNGSKEITSVPSTTTFTFTVDEDATTPATGTMTVQRQNILLRYYKYITNLSSDTDELVLPDQFTDGIVAFALGRIFQRDGERGNAADSFDEFNNAQNDLIKLNNEHIYNNQGIGPMSPDLVAGYATRRYY